MAEYQEYEINRCTSMKLLRRISNWWRVRLPKVNIILALGAYLANQYLIQGFCQPVTWVWWVLIPSLGAFLAWPWLKQLPRLHYLLLWLQGVFLLVCLYCTLFMVPYLPVALFLGFLVLPLLVWTPVVFGIQVVKRVWTSPLPSAWWVFGAGMLPLLLAQGWAWQQYRQVTAAVAVLPLAQRHQAGPLLRVVPHTFMAERLAGQLFKYHAYPEMVYDGWRPPLHDPLVNLCMEADDIIRRNQVDTIYSRLRPGPGPLIIESWDTQDGFWKRDINEQAAFYHALFPDEQVKATCACAHTHDAEAYYSWQPGLTDNIGTALVGVERHKREYEALVRAQADSVTATKHAASRP